MIRRILFTSLLLVPALGIASTFDVKTDVTVPFRLNLNGQGVTTRENTMLGVEVGHHPNDLLEWGVRFQFDVEEKGGTFRRSGVGPYLGEHWMREETWHPFARIELPFLWRGAPNNLANNTQVDLGIGLGVGVDWHPEKWPVSIYYNFGFHYFFGISDALSVLSIDLFRIGLAYHF